MRIPGRVKRAALKKHQTLNRVLGPAEVMFLAFSALSPVVSFYIGGDTVLHLAGTGAALAFILGGVASVALSLLYAEVGAAFPGAGGLYPSLAGVFGPLLAFPYVILLAPIAFAAPAFAVLGLADYVRVFLPGAPRALIVLVALFGAAGVAALNIRSSTWVTGVFLAVEFLALSALTVVAVNHPARDLGAALRHPMMASARGLRPTSWAALGLATVSGIWATSGSNWALYFAEEMVEARRRIGRTIAWTGLIAAVVVAAPMVVMVASIRDPAALFAEETPIAAFLRQTGGPKLAALVSGGVVLAIFNSLVANIMGYARYFYATGRDGIWPKPISALLGHLDGARRSPDVATALVAIVSGAATLFGEKSLLILLSGNVSDYLLISLAVLVGRPKGLTGAEFRAPLHPLLPVFGLGVTALSMLADWMDPEAGRPSVVLLTLLFASALLYFHVRLRQISTTWFKPAEIASAAFVKEPRA